MGTQSHRNRKIEGKIPQWSPGPFWLSKSFVIPCRYLSGLLSKTPTPSINTTFPCLTCANGKVQQSVPGSSQAACLCPQGLLPRHRAKFALFPEFVPDESMLSAVYFLAIDWKFFRELKLSWLVFISLPFLLQGAPHLLFFQACSTSSALQKCLEAPDNGSVIVSACAWWTLY